jgi:hypothetical protein
LPSRQYFAPWIMFAPTSFLFDAWLKTLLASGMAYFVASLVAKGADGFTAAAAAADGGPERCHLLDHLGHGGVRRALPGVADLRLRGRQGHRLGRHA